MNEVIATDRQGVAVASDYPNTQVRIGALETGCDCRRPAVDAVKAVRVHVVRKARRATDAGNEHDLFARDAEFRHNLLHVVQDCIVAASRAPAHFLVGNEVGLF